MKSDTLTSTNGYSEVNGITMYYEIYGIPGVHGEYIEEITTLKSNSKEARFVIPMLEGFLDKGRKK